MFKHNMTEQATLCMAVVGTALPPRRFTDSKAEFENSLTKLIMKLSVRYDTKSTFGAVSCTLDALEAGLAFLEAIIPAEAIMAKLHISGARRRLERTDVDLLQASFQDHLRNAGDPITTLLEGAFVAPQGLEGGLCQQVAEALAAFQIQHQQQKAMASVYSHLSGAHGTSQQETGRSSRPAAEHTGTSTRLHPKVREQLGREHCISHARKALGVSSAGCVHKSCAFKHEWQPTEQQISLQASFKG
jgi:hypothetical protein